MDIGELGVMWKADLHLHQERSARIDQVLAGRAGTPATDWGSWRDRLVADVDPGLPRLHALWQSMPAPFSADRDPEVLTVRLERVMMEAAADGAVLAEVRAGNETVLRNDFVRCFRSAEQRVRDVNPNFHAEPVVTVKLWHDVRQVERVLALCLDLAGSELHGIDLLSSPFEIDEQWTVAAAICSRAATAGLGITAHAGEMSSDDLDVVLRLPGLTRVGHAIHAARSRDLLDRLADAHVVVECCLSSNVVLGAVRSYAEHPIRAFLAHGVPVVLGTDDPLELGTSIGTEYAMAAQLGLSAQDLRCVTRRAIDVAFTSDARRVQMQRIVSVD